MIRTMQLEKLEKRDLMTIVAVFNERSGLLSITGDDADDVVDVDGTGTPGVMNVTENAFVTPIERGTFTGVKSITINLGKGGDEAYIAGVQIPGNLKVIGGLGNDRCQLDNTPDVGTEPDSPLFIGGSVTVNLGGHAGDDFYWYGDPAGGFGATVSKNVSITGVQYAAVLGNGTSAIETIDINIGGNLKIKFGGPVGSPFSSTLNGVNVFGSTGIKGSTLNDEVLISGSNFFGKVKIGLGKGNDTIDLDNSSGSRFNSAVSFSFGADDDTLDDNGTNVFLTPFKATGGPENTI